MIRNIWRRQILVRVDRETNLNADIGVRRSSLPLALEGLDRPPPVEAATATGVAAGSSAVVVFYRLLDPDAAVEQLKSKWSELVEPPAAAAAATCSDSSGTDLGGSSSSGSGTPWSGRLGIGLG